MDSPECTEVFGICLAKCREGPREKTLAQLERLIRRCLRHVSGRRSWSAVLRPWLLQLRSLMPEQWTQVARLLRALLLPRRPGAVARQQPWPVSCGVQGCERQARGCVKDPDMTCSLGSLPLFLSSFMSRKLMPTGRRDPAVALMVPGSATCRAAIVSRAAAWQRTILGQLGGVVRSTWEPKTGQRDSTVAQ